MFSVRQAIPALNRRARRASLAIMLGGPGRAGRSNRHIHSHSCVRPLLLHRGRASFVPRAPTALNESGPRKPD
jgi:hypothetical protein